jgi:RNA polymerase sigma-70 factor (sigma-E family)
MVLLGDVQGEILAQDIISDDAADFEEFAASRWPALVRLGYGLTGDRYLAEDLAQTALAKAYLAWRRVSRADDPDAYVYRILINAANRRFRRRRVTELPASGRYSPPDVAVPDHAPLAADRAELLAALRELPPRQRAVVLLRYWADLTDSQAATALGCSPATVRSQSARALAKLRESLTGGAESDG